MRLNKKHPNVAFIFILLTLMAFYTEIKISTAAPKTIRVPEEYGTIQAAINAATTGDTILVAPGTYNEYVCVNKSIILKGTNRQSIIRGGPGSTTRVVDVKIGKITFTGNIAISGFTIQGPATSYQGIYVEPPVGTYFTNINVTDNTIIGCNDAIFYSRSTKCYITNNTLQRNTYGIRLYDSNYNFVAENFINASSYYGITFYARSRYNNMTENTILNCRYGVLLEYANSTTMYLNTIKSCTEYAIRLSYTYYSLIKGNTLHNNKYGVYVWNCSQNQFYYNNFITNTIQADKYNAVLAANLWDTNINPGAKGNYWSDYAGADDGTGAGRWGEPRVAGDGIGDTLIPHSRVLTVPWYGLDWYPLMYPWAPVPLIHPVAIFTWSPLEPIYNQPVTFNASKSYDVNGTIISYKWDFSDGTPIVIETDPITYHTFTTPGNYTVTLTVTDNDFLTNSTSQIVRVLLYKLVIDVYTQQKPYSGRGPNQPSDAFAPQSNVLLYAEVTYNYEPLENKDVSFTVTDPDGYEVFYRSNSTNAEGMTFVSFRLPTNGTFGLYSVLAAVEISQRKANDTLTFLVGWIVEVINIATVDQYGLPKAIFVKGEQIYFSADVKNIAFTSKNATLTVGIQDETLQMIGVTDIRLEVPPGTYHYNIMFNVLIPKWTLVGTGSAHVCAFTDWPWRGGVPYCPEASTTFLIIPA